MKVTITGGEHKGQVGELLSCLPDQGMVQLEQSGILAIIPADAIKPVNPESEGKLWPA
jgi:hypothetical protein